jgi:hypothetical protein
VTQSDETDPGSLSSRGSSPTRLRVGQIGTVSVKLTGTGLCWRLVYDDCGHALEFAREGLEDPVRLVQFVQRNFAKCLTCHQIARTADRD